MGRNAPTLLDRPFPASSSVRELKLFPALIMNRTICALTAVILCLLPSPARAALTCSTGKVELHDAFEGQQLLVADAGRDVTREVTYRSADPKIAVVDEKGYVTPSGDGATTLRITLGTETLEVPVVVRGFTKGRAVDFRT